MNKEMMNQLAMKYLKGRISSTIGEMVSIEKGISEDIQMTIEGAKECLLWISDSIDGRGKNRFPAKAADELKKRVYDLRIANIRLDTEVEDYGANMDLGCISTACEILNLWAKMLKEDEKTQNRKHITLHRITYYFHLEWRKNNYIMVLTNSAGGVMDEEYFDECSMRMIWNDAGTTNKDKITMPLNKLLVRMSPKEAMKFRKCWTAKIDEMLDIVAEADASTDDQHVREKISAFLNMPESAVSRKTA